ncbi:mechanosensitive ion channel family protein [Jiangella sp. DSM 45060]|uniref:mechanosensitive ion channel family protein n=1 Tax=Jiangella sp. DSM 45060 TaxID=1798224 RepID=UPI00087C2A4E|nr:mechanosensitive ion channel domain-containing protein [Jiangella sp. DSM 45060]SDS54542.1 Mechanosensitive ion channel [Jiangella sp. DSM 45060]
MRDFLSGMSFTAWDVVLALAVIVAAWLCARYARRAADRILAGVRVPDDLRRAGVRLTGYVVIFLGVGIALSLLGASIQPVLAVAILLAVVAFLALRGIADNVAAGIVIQTRRPVRIDDTIEALGYTGRVRELNSRSVIIETTDGRVVHLPNQKLLDNPFVNHSATGRNASELQVRIGGDAEEGTAELIAGLLAQTPGVLADPPPRVLVRAVEPRRTTLSVTCWHRPSDGAAVVSAAVTAIGRRLAAPGRAVSVVAPPPAPALVPPPEV